MHELIESKTVICLMGPTASGKSHIALKLAETLSGEIINVDSMLVYRGLDIGTAKPSRDERKRIAHHLIDIREAYEPYSAAEFVTDANQTIADCLSRKKVPLCVGGTMLYYKALQQGLSVLPKAEQEVRATLQRELEQKGLATLHQELTRIDAQAGARIHPNDPQRILRALEVFRITGKSITELWQQGLASETSWRFLNLGIMPESREVLHQQIAARFNSMCEQGFITEVTRLKQNPKIHAEQPAMRSVGYRQAWEYLDGQIDEATMREKAIIATRQLAKRQLTWLRAWPDLFSFKMEEPMLYETILKFLQDGIF